MLGPATLGGPRVGPLLAAVASAGARGRTTALAATLLELALAGRVAEPARVLLDLDPVGERAWPDALARLGRLGHSTGRAWAFGIGAAAALLGGGPPALDNPVLGGSVAAGIRRL